jgi:uncharacterized OB-fold protein
MTHQRPGTADQEPGTEDQGRPNTAAIPLPVPNPDNEGFWDGCRRHELRVQRCRRCRTFRHHPRPMCPHCSSTEHEWVAVSGRGVLYTFTIVYDPTLPAFQAQIPYNVAVVQLEEGPFMVTNIVGCAADQMRIGAAVAVEFEDLSSTISLPKFRPAL